MKEINWSLFDKEFTDWMFYTYEEEKNMPPYKIIILMSSAWAKGYDIGFDDGYDDGYAAREEED